MHVYLYMCVYLCFVQYSTVCQDDLHRVFSFDQTPCPTADLLSRQVGLSSH
jgi:hypothetical protein